MRGTARRGRECRLSVGVNHHGHEPVVLFLSHGCVATLAACVLCRLLSTLSSALPTGGPAAATATASQGAHPARHVDTRLSGFEIAAGTLALHAAAPPRRILHACGWTHGCAASSVLLLAMPEIKNGASRGCVA